VGSEHIDIRSGNYRVVFKFQPIWRRMSQVLSDRGYQLTNDHIFEYCRDIGELCRDMWREDLEKNKYTGALASSLRVTISPGLLHPHPKGVPSIPEGTWITTRVDPRVGPASGLQGVSPIDYAERLDFGGYEDIDDAYEYRLKVWAYDRNIKYFNLLLEHVREEGFDAYFWSERGVTEAILYAQQSADSTTDLIISRIEREAHGV